MADWDSVLSRDYAEAIDKGTVDSDLDRMKRCIEDRVIVRDVKPCPLCGELHIGNSRRVP